MEGLRVAELAERAGIAPSTVRFYERAGLLSPARRAPNGYRIFGESAVDELAFINRAKTIGMSLEDIAGLVAAWPTGECRSLQARMRDFLTRRISQVREQQAELAAFERQLQTVLGRLASRDPGPEQCGHGCGCETDLDLAPDQAGSGPVPWGTSWALPAAPPEPAHCPMTPSRPPATTPAGNGTKASPQATGPIP
jgi:DNA-binding transcriptional MerR regulator